MTKETLQRGRELVGLISTTNAGLHNLSRRISLEEKKKSTVTSSSYTGTPDKVYSLCICESSDGSGDSADLTRYEGNAEVINAIIEVLKNQLAKYQKEFDNL